MTWKSVSCPRGRDPCTGPPGTGWRVSLPDQSVLTGYSRLTRRVRLLLSWMGSDRGGGSVTGCLVFQQGPTGP